jgi:hypothetical protein
MEERRGIRMSLLAMLCSLLLLGGKCVQDAQNAASMHAEAAALAARVEARAAGLPMPPDVPQRPAPSFVWVVLSIVLWFVLCVGAITFTVCAYMDDEPVPARATALALLVAALMYQLAMV